MFWDGYKYWLAYTKSGTSYFRCARHKDNAAAAATTTTERCPGRCIRRLSDGQLRNMHAHNHPPDADRKLVDTFRQVLTQRAVAEPAAGLHTIYWDEASQRHLDAAMLYGFVAAESAMRKARLRHQRKAAVGQRQRQQQQQLEPCQSGTDEQFCAPVALATAEEVDAFLAGGGAAKLLRLSGDGGGDASFYRTTLKLATGISCWIFGHEQTLQRLEKVEQMHVDASLRDVLPGYSVVIFHGIHSAGSTPLVYAIISAPPNSQPAASANRAASPPPPPAPPTQLQHTIYAILFAYVREHYPAQYASPAMIITNSCPAMLKAATYAYPDATCKVFWHEYTGAVLHRIRHSSHAAALRRQTGSGHGCSALRMLLVLPLLPADYMQPGLEAVRRWAADKQQLTGEMLELCQWVSAHWLRPLGVGKLSMFGVPGAMHSHAARLARELRAEVGRRTGGAAAADAGAWRLLRAVAQLAQRAWCRLRQQRPPAGGGEGRLQQQQQQPAPGLKRDRQRAAIVTDATEQWIRQPVHLRNPLQFLQLSSHCANDLLWETAQQQQQQEKRGRAEGGQAKRDSVAHQSQQVAAENASNVAAACSFDQLLQNDHNYFFDTTPSTEHCAATASSSATASAAGLYQQQQQFTVDPLPAESMHLFDSSDAGNRFGYSAAERGGGSHVLQAGTEQQQQQQPSQPAQLQQQPTSAATEATGAATKGANLRTDPPPLLFYKAKTTASGGQRLAGRSAGPPPLVAIGSGRSAVKRKAT